MVATASFIATAQSTADASAYTHSVNLGSAGQYSHIFVGATARGTAPRNIDSLTVAGNAAAERHSNSNGNNFAELWSVPYSAGGVQDIVVTWNNTMVRGGIVVWGVNGLNSHTPSDTALSAADPSSAAIDIEAGGFALIVALSSGLTTATPVGTGIGEDADIQIDDTNDNTFWGGSGNFAAGQAGLTIGCDFAAASEPVMCAAAWAGSKSLIVPRRRLMFVGQRF